MGVVTVMLNVAMTPTGDNLSDLVVKKWNITIAGLDQKWTDNGEAFQALSAFRLCHELVTSVIEVCGRKKTALKFSKLEDTTGYPCPEPPVELDVPILAATAYLNVLKDSGYDVKTATSESAAVGTDSLTVHKSYVWTLAA